MPKGVRIGGRQKGTPNKATADVRKMIAAFAEGSVAELQAKFDEIDDPARWVDLWARIIEYHIPKLGRTEVTGQDGGPLKVVEIVRETADPK